MKLRHWRQQTKIYEKKKRREQKSKRNKLNKTKIVEYHIGVFSSRMRLIELTAVKSPANNTSSINHTIVVTTATSTFSFSKIPNLYHFNMLDIFRGLKNLIKVNHVKTDSPVFRLHYSITVMVLMSFSLIVTTRQYVGNPIDCVHTKDLPEDVLNTYCWIHSTYTLKSLFRKKVGVEVPYPGVGNSEGKLTDRKVYRYYQWVCFCLFFQVNENETSFTLCC